MLQVGVKFENFALRTRFIDLNQFTNPAHQSHNLLGVIERVVQRFSVLLGRPHRLMECQFERTA